VSRDLDFGVNERAFVKTHARQLSEPKKFVLLLAYLAKGQAGKDVQLKDIENHWNKMTAPNLLDGNFNRFYTSSAKENGWVNTKKQSAYFLRPHGATFWPMNKATYGLQPKLKSILETAPARKDERPS
jgi:hypothetical protein